MLITPASRKKAGTAALLGVLGLWFIPTATTLIALAVVAIAWDIPVPSIWVIILTCALVGPTWFFTTMSTLRIMGMAVDDEIDHHLGTSRH
ncbi:hypothetical protein [Acidiphilium angustum]|uniref:hypothetical protein n=1 Tax=Acidiphilium angustum TaxID=523 RepID=UPI0004940CEA|nr:hypothetical protein [Acidiphilium angustum]